MYELMKMEDPFYVRKQKYSISKEGCLLFFDEKIGASRWS